MLLAALAVLFGLALLVWSADRFVDGASATAAHLSVPPLLVGMVIVGFGTSAPELVVSVLSSLQGIPALALGNAWGSNIANIGLILGVTALVSPILVESAILRRELPILIAVTGLTWLVAGDASISRADAAVLLGVFLALMTWAILEGLRNKEDALGIETAADLRANPLALPRALASLAVGLVVLVGSSRLLVWGAVAIATSLGVSELVVGLTVVAIGTSLPELASCVVAARRGEHDLALGNVLGSNLFNTLAVVGTAGAVATIPVGVDVLARDLPVMAGLTGMLFVMAWGFRGRQGRINRVEALVLLLAYVAYTTWLLTSASGGS